MVMPPVSHRPGDPRLVAVLDGRPAGAVHQGGSGRLRFHYDEAWRSDPDAYPLSLSMPLAEVEHGHESTSAFLWGLLPDNARVLDHYGRRFGVSAGNPVALLTHLGPDCAGAVQLAAPDAVEPLLGGQASRSIIEWLTPKQVAAELRAVREHGIPSVPARTAGQFSLSGAQPKLALYADGDRWGRPAGRTPTNVILKPPSTEFVGFAENEHFCLALAAAAGLAAASSRVRRFGDEVAIVVNRFDRVKVGRRWHRVHQEDACQALGIMPTRKYESEGGPGVRDIVQLLREVSHDAEADVARFLAAVAFTWIIAATDGHAKNYAFLHGAQHAVRLAPLYDVASDLPYADRQLHRVKLAMKVGSQYAVGRIGRSQWASLAASLRMAPARLLDSAATLSQRVAASVERVAQTAIADGLDRTVIIPLAERIAERARSCLDALA